MDPFAGSGTTAVSAKNNGYNLFALIIQKNTARWLRQD